LDEIWKAGQRSGGPWRELSRAVVTARDRFEAARGLAGDEEEAAFNEMLLAIDAMATIHASDPAEVRGLTNLIFEKTGARLVGMTPHPARAFHEIKADIASLAHSSGSWEEAIALRNRAVAELARLFKPPSDHIEGIRDLALVTAPGIEAIEHLESIITNEHHLRLFLAEIPDLGWVLALGTRQILAPSPHGGAWPAISVVERFADTHPDELIAWLTNAYGAWSHDPNAPVAFAAWSCRTFSESKRNHELAYPQQSPVAASDGVCPPVSSWPRSITR
jgi:hypothetical protein